MMTNVTTAPRRPWWLLSFASDDRFLGGYLTESPSFEAAFLRASLTGCNPGGQVAGVSFYSNLVDRDYADRLLTQDEVENMPKPSDVVFVTEER